jgi:hypothetical protein
MATHLTHRLPSSFGECIRGFFAGDISELAHQTATTRGVFCGGMDLTAF